MTGYGCLTESAPARFLCRRAVFDDLVGEIHFAAFSIFDDAEAILKLPRHLSMHPGGVIVAPGTLTDLVPVMRSGGKGVIITQLDLESVEALGLVKIDLLGNRALSTVDEARQLAAAAVPGATQSENDAATIDLLRRGDTVGITQMESPAMRHLIIQLQTRGLEDVIQSLALLRPARSTYPTHQICFRMYL
jgi:DNA polymerase III alpha subunit